MTLKIKNIRYDHSLDTKTYPAGVLTVDSTDNSVHVHDGVLPNGSRLPTVSDLNDKADVSLGNVSQEELTNLLSRYGALTMNDNKSVSEAQRDNLWDKLGGPAMRFDTEIPENNVAVVNKDTHKLEVKDVTALGIFVGIDTTSAAARTMNVPYTATRDCWLCVFPQSANTGTSNYSTVKIDGVVVACAGFSSRNPKYTTGSDVGSLILPIKKGQVYELGGNPCTATEYGLKY